jgi:isoleucyl-tRNA synthetase
VLLEGWNVASEGNLSVAVDPRLDDELVTEGRALDLVRELNELRKQQGLQLTDRIALRLPASYADLVESHGPWIASEVLAISTELDGDIDQPVIRVEAI